MPIRHVDPEKIEAVLSYLRQNFSDHMMTTFPDPDNFHQQGYRMGWKGNGSMVRTFVVRIEFFNETEIHNIATRLHGYNLAYVLQSTNGEQVVVTEWGIHR